ADWTQLLSDPDLVSHLGELLQAYREAPPDKRDEALLHAMRQIKSGSAKMATPDATTSPAAAPPAQVATTAPEISPPFEPDIFTPSWGQDRRRHPRMKCFVAVELRVGGSATPVWGNLSDTSLGGCFVETATPVPSGADLEIGLWLANGKIWIKGVILTGIVTKSSPCFGVRVKFAELAVTERETLRHFLKFVESTTKGYHNEQAYLSKLER
ncbi:MAG TPA: PilZ domain-containing protein, partial [Terriglobales bacterium]|nr:PilZ domain-containing protein [Terriglobales bacterium]